MLKRILALIAVSTLLLTCCAAVLAKDENETDILRGADDGEKLKIACVGDSVTWGRQVAEDKGTSYPSFLQMLLGDRAQVRNFGWPGACVTKGRDLSYGGSSYHTNSLAFMADVVIFGIGANDSQRGIWSAGTFEKDYEELLNTYRDQGNDPLILILTGGYCIEDEKYAATWGVPGKSTIGKWGEDDDTMKNLIQPAQQRVADKYGISTVDMRAFLMGNPEAYICKEDGVHYTDAGYRDEAQLIYEVLLGLVELPGGGEADGSMPDPTSLNNVTIGEYDGQQCVMWKNGATGGFSYDSGALAFALGIPSGTVVDTLTLKVSYLWDHHTGGNDWWWFNTTDENGESAPGIANGNPHDNGFGTFTQYGMSRGEWSELTVTRQRQLLGGDDWTVYVGVLESTNSLYFRGWHIEATLADGTVKSADWGSYVGAEEPVDKSGLQAELDTFIADVVYTDDTYAAYTDALAAAQTVMADENADQEQVDAAAAALKAAREGLVIKTAPAALKGDADGDGDITSTDARLALQIAVGKIGKDAVDYPDVLDVDQDGDITSTDARLILQYAVNKITEWP